ncbi:MAG TPA: hypothetical protein VGS97_13625 [Actinocrinis sp.]|nr:hypothetical protein [Actinocrinis sp.]
MVGVPVTPEHIEHVLWTAELTAAFGSLLTFAAGHRIEAFEEWPVTDQGGETIFMSLGHMSDKRLEAPSGGDLIEKLNELVDRITHLDEDSARVVLAALQLHYGACVLAPVSPTSAYMSIVAGIEALSREFGNPPHEWSAWDMAGRWDRFMAEADLSADQAEMLRARLMKDQHMRLAETFGEYASTRLPESFWTDEHFDWIYVGDGRGGHLPGYEQSRYHFSESVPTDRRTLKACLKESYRLRSQFVHTGESEVTYLTPMSTRKHETDPSVHADGAPKKSAPLPFAALRSILTSLISAELDAGTS